MQGTILVVLLIVILATGLSKLWSALAALVAFVVPMVFRPAPSPEYARTIGASVAFKSIEQEAQSTGQPLSALVEAEIRRMEEEDAGAGATTNAQTIFVYKRLLEDRLSKTG